MNEKLKRLETEIFYDRRLRRIDAIREAWAAYLKTTESMWIEEARMLAAQCWCDPDTETKIMDPVLCEAVAQRIANWMDTAAQNQRNADYYRGLVVRCGEAIGSRAYVADDGSRSEDVLCAKVPELVEAAFCNG